MKLFCDVARENGSSVALKDLIALTSIDYSEEQLANSWDNYSELSSKYTIASGLVLERSSNDIQRLEREKSNILARFDRANSNITCALEFGALLGNGAFTFKVLSISGSTSYLSVSETDDLDFFCIAKSGTMWISFVRSLILARAFRLVRKDSPWICLSYVSDDKFVRDEFLRNQNGLFARDALSTRIVHGEKYFVDLLSENSWMALYFPKLYFLRIKKKTRESHTKPQSASSFEKVVNLFLYYTAGSYVRLKSSMLNRKFARDRKLSSIFNLRIGVNHCIYESADYVRLRRLYSSLRRKN